MSFPKFLDTKDSGVDWLGEIPSHWSVKELKYVCTNQPSNVDKKTKEGEEGVSLCNYTDVYYNDRITSELPLMRASATDEQIEKFTLRAGDVIITKDSESADDIAVSTYVPEDMPGVVCGYHLAMIRPKNGTCGKFIKRLFDSVYIRSKVATLANGLTRFGLGHSAVGGLELPIPPEDEQKAISSFLDVETSKIDRLVSEQHRLIELLKEKRQAVISHAVTKGLNPNAPMKPSGFDWIGDIPKHWTTPPVYARFEQVLGKMLDHAKMTGEHPTPYLRNADVRWDYINVDDLPIMDIKPEERERFMVRKGDLLMVEGRELGRGAIWEGDDDVVAFQKALHRLRSLNETEHTRYFYYTMLFANGTNVFLANESPNEIPHLTGEQLRRYRFPKPPPEEQVGITEFLDEETEKFDSLVSDAERAIELLQERRTALISAAVTGKIDVREFVCQEMA